MFLLVSAHPGCPRQNSESRKTVVVVVVVVLQQLHCFVNLLYMLLSIVPFFTGIMYQ